MRSKALKTKIYLLIGIALLAFIWLHSAMSHDSSANESGRVMEIITPLLELFVGKGNVTEHLVRKLAHFIEYTALGMDLLLLVRSWPKKPAWPIAIGCGWMASFLDESIQMLVPERGPAIVDVWLDLAGILFGTLLSWILVGIFKEKI